MRKKIEKALESVMEEGAGYADARFQEGTSSRIEIKNDEVDELGSSEDRGIGIRAFYRGVWGFASSNSDENLEATARRALKMAKYLRNTSDAEEFELDAKDSVDVSIDDNASIRPSYMSVDQKLAVLEDAERAMRHVSDYIKSSKVRYRDYDGRYLFVNSEGSFIEKERSSFACYFYATSKKQGRTESFLERSVANGGFERFTGDKPVKLAEKAARMADKLLDAEKNPTGRMPVILGDRIGGLLAHEAVGHAAEADTVLSGDSIFEGRRGEKLASEEVTLVDDPTLEERFGSFRYDDEGVKAGRTEIIREGVLNSFLHSRETASRMGCEDTGNGRADSYGSRPIVRMSNTFFESGGCSREELVESIDRGLIINGFKGGQVSTKEGNFTFGASHGYLVEDGEIKQMVRRPNLSGRTLKVLKNISMVGEDLSVGDPGFCGKDGQSVSTDNGAPEMKIDEMVVG